MVIMNEILFKPRVANLDAITSGRPGGLRSKWSISPLDLPEMVKIGFNDGKTKFVIAFNYISEEVNQKSDFLSNGVELLRGECSGRIYQIIIPCPIADGPSVLMEYLKTTSKLLSERADSLNRPMDFAKKYRDRAVGSVLESPKSGLMENIERFRMR